jgi:hypothetical protein
MAQHDYIIANQSGAAFRSDLNNVLAAIVSNNGGAAQPSPTYAYMWWDDFATGLVKKRNAANNGWYVVGTLGATNLGLLSLAGGTLTGALLVDDSGTAALPAIAFDGDPNTGIFSPGADQLAIATNGVERVEFGTTEVVFNDGGADVDFRVEGDTKPNLFKVDAGADTVIIDGLTHPSADGSADQALVTNGSGGLSFASRSRLVSSTAVSASGVATTFTGIPSWARRITFMFTGLSSNGTAAYLARLGDSGGVESTGYISSSNFLQGGVTDASTNSTIGFVLFTSSASNVLSGQLIISNYDGNGWVTTGMWDYSNTTGQTGMTAGYKGLSGTLDRVQIATANGTDTFDSGTLSIIYEG